MKRPSVERNPERLVFFGTPEFAVPALEALQAAGFDIPLVVTQPDRPRGRRKTPVPPPVKVKAVELGVPVAQPENPNDAAFVKELTRIGPELIVTAAYGHLLKREILTLPADGCLNLHASLLPKYRGAAPIAWAILSGDTVTGVTVMLMNEGMDTGPILRRRETPILPDETTESLTHRLARIGAEILPETIHDFVMGIVSPLPQDDRQATAAPPLKKSDGRIDWQKPAVAIERQIRAMIPWPSAFTRVAGRTLKIYRAAVIEAISSLPPGHGKVDDNAWIVNTGRGALSLLEIQMEGKKRMAIRDFLKGFKKRGEIAFG